MYQITLSRAAERDINKIDKKHKPHVFAALFDLRKEPFLGKRLKGRFQDCYSLRIGIYRIIYKIYKKELNILVIRIGHRQGIYK